MRTSGSQNPYEVYCYQCNVTAPTGTRRCVHCGGQLSGAREPLRATLTDLFEAKITEADEESEEVSPSGASRVPKIAMWILFLIGWVLYRFCN